MDITSETTYTIWCGRCGDVDEVSDVTKSEAIKKVA